MKVLLVIDVQKEFKDKDGVYEKCVNYVNENKDKYDEVLATVFVNENSNFKKHLNWSECKTASEDSLEFDSVKVRVKQGYAYTASLPKDAEIDVIGCDQNLDLGGDNIRLQDTAYDRG